MSDANDIIEVTDATFEQDVLEQSRYIPVVVDFWAPWCGPCRTLTPVLERLAQDSEQSFVLAKINVDDNPATAMQYQVMSIPAVKGFIDGEVAAEFTGSQPETKVRDFLSRLVPSELDEALGQATAYLALHRWADAEAVLKDLLRSYPGHKVAGFHMARALLGQANGCAALPYLESQTDGRELIASERLLPLAHYLCRVQTAEADEDDLPPLEAQYNRAALLLSRGNPEAAMDGLLDTLREDKQYRDGEPKAVMLAMFELLGDDDELTQSYRSELARVLF